MSTDLRTVDFTIQEEPGAFITTPASMKSTSPEGVFPCEVCQRPIGEREPMFMLMKPSAPKVWRHVYLDHCGKIAYTVGLVSSYEPSIDEAAAKGETVHKTGRMPEDNYEGGWIWRTREEAQAKIDNPAITVNGKPDEWTQGKVFKVYGVLMEGTWETDVSPEVYADGVHRLWVTSKEVFRLP
jgi:hypothetical protein